MLELMQCRGVLDDLSLGTNDAAGLQMGFHGAVDIGLPSGIAERRLERLQLLDGSRLFGPAIPMGLTVSQGLKLLGQNIVANVIVAVVKMQVETVLDVSCMTRISQVRRNGV